MKKLQFAILLLLAVSVQSFGQQIALTFQEAEAKGIPIDKLDSIYRSAVNVDTSLAVFKTEKEQEAMHQAYVKLLQDFGSFLYTNNFNWEKPTRCFNRIYFNENGTIDYFLYNFLGMPTDKLTNERQKVFNQLLNKFIINYKFELTSTVKFAQCSPVTYTPK